MTAPQLIAVDGNPFASSAPQSQPAVAAPTTKPRLVAVEGDPFGAPAKPAPRAKRLPAQAWSDASTPVRDDSDPAVRDVLTALNGSAPRTDAITRIVGPTVTERARRLLPMTDNRGAPDTTATGAFRRSAGRAVLPAAGGAAGFGAGFAAGGTLAGPTAAFSGPVGPAIGAVGGGLLGAFGGGWIIDKAQDRVLSMLPDGVVQALGQDSAVRAADQAQHPIASFSGALAPNLLFMRPGFSGAPVAEGASKLTRVLASPVTGAGVGATVSGAGEGVRQAIDGEFDPVKLGIATAFGAVTNRPTTLGQSLFQAGGNGTIRALQAGVRAAEAMRPEPPIDFENMKRAQPVDQGPRLALPAPDEVAPVAARPEPAPEPVAPAGSDTSRFVPDPIVSAGGDDNRFTLNLTAKPKLVAVDGDPFAAAPVAAVTEPPKASPPEPSPVVEPQPVVKTEPVTPSASGGLRPDTPEPVAPTVSKAETVAPVAKPEPAPAPEPVAVKPEPDTLGDGERYVTTPSGTRIRTKFEVVDSTSLVQAEGANQNRDRSRASTDLQVQNIVSKFDPEQLHEDLKSDRGAPIVAADNAIDSGNGRVLALNKIHDQYPEQAAAYRAMIEKRGLSTEGIARPILIQRRLTDMTPEDRRKFVIDSNTDNKLELTPIERAKGDADAIDASTLSLYRGGDITHATNTDFVKAFMSRLPAAQHGAMLDDRGQLSQDGTDRVERAMMARAYEDPAILGMLTERGDNNIRSIGAGLLDNAGEWAGLRQSIKDGDVLPDFDVTKQLVEAARKVSDIRAKGTKIGDALSQTDVFNPTDPIVDGLMRTFYNPELTRAASRQAITDAIQTYVRRAAGQTTAPKLFGGGHEITPLEIIQGILDARNEEKHGGMFAMAAEDKFDAHPAGQSLPEMDAYDPDFASASFTNRVSIHNSAARAAGFTPEEFNLLPGPRQFKELSRVMLSKFGVAVTKEGGLQDRMAIDQLLDAYQNVQAMAHVLGVSNRAISLGGTLKLELMKDKRQFLGVFMPTKSTIGLPGRSNSFAHEWGHAVDYHLLGALTGEQARGITGAIRSKGVDFTPRNLREAFTGLLNAMFFDQTGLAHHIMQLEARLAATKSATVRASVQAQIDNIKAGAGKTPNARSLYYKSAMAYDGPGGDYWQSPTEMFARAFEAYVSNRADMAGLGTEFIGKGDASYLSEADERFAKTFPKRAERDIIFQKMDDVFEQLAKEAILAGPAAERPLPSEDGMPPEPRAGSWLERAVASELGAFNDARVRRQQAMAGRAKDPRTFGMKANDIAGYFGYGMTAEMKMIGRRHQSATIRKLHDLLNYTTGEGKRVQPRGFISAVRLLDNQLSNRVDKAFKDFGPRGLAGRSRALTADENKMLRDLLISEDVPDAPRALVALAATLRKIEDDTFYMLQQVGIDVGYTKNGHLMRMPDLPVIMGDEAGFLEAAAQAYALGTNVDGSAVTSAQADEMAEGWLRAMKAAEPEEFDARAPSTSFLKNRTLPPEADKILERFYINDPREVVETYLHQAVRRIEYARRFGHDGAKLRGMFKTMSREGVPGIDIATIQHITGLVTGHQSASIAHPTVRTAVSALRFIYGTAALLPRAVFSSLHESLSAGIVMGGPKHGVHALFATLEQALNTASASERREIARITGMVSAGIGSDVMAERMGGAFGDNTRWDRLAARMYYNSGLTALTRAQQTGNVAPAHAFLYSLSRAIERGAEVTGRAKAMREDALARFNELGIRAPEKFAKWMLDPVRAKPSAADALAGTSDPAANPEAFDWITAVDRLKSQAIQEPSVMSRPRAASTPVGQFVYGIMSFNYEQWRNIIKGETIRAKERAERSGAGYTAEKAAFGLVPALAAVLIGSIVTTFLREYLTNRERFEKAKADGTLNSHLVTLGINRAIGTPIDPIIQAGSGMKYNRAPALQLLGPTLGNLGTNIADIASLGVRNSRNTNTAEHNAVRGAYRLISPWGVAALSALPGGPVASGVYGAVASSITSPQAGETAGNMVVGDKDHGKVKTPTKFDSVLNDVFGKPAKKKRAK